MNIIERVKNILVKPREEWKVIALETPNSQNIMTGYVLVLAGAAAIAAFIGWAFIAKGGVSWGVYHAIGVVVSAIIAVILSAFVVDALAPSFGAEKNLPRSIQLVAYSYTPLWIGGLLSIVPQLTIVGNLIGLYSLYLLYEGLKPIKKVSEEKRVGYFVVSLLVMIIATVVVSIILQAILAPLFPNPYDARFDPALYQ